MSTFSNELKIIFDFPEVVSKIEYNEVVSAYVLVFTAGNIGIQEKDFANKLKKLCTFSIQGRFAIIVCIHHTDKVYQESKPGTSIDREVTNKDWMMD